jgi:L-ascorbate metabolism protein UlaG (beta-lactamase superfamily)
MMKKIMRLSTSIWMVWVLTACAAPAASPTPPAAVPPATTVPTLLATMTPVPPTLKPAQPSPTEAPATATPAASTVSSATPAKPAEAGAPSQVTLTWWGQATFVLSGGGLHALLDPAGNGIGYTIPVQDNIDLVTVSHNHSDHNAVSLAAGKPLVFQAQGGEWPQVSTTVKGVGVRSVGVYHDTQQGAARGKNAIFIFDFNGLRIAHLGDLGHTLTPEQLNQVGPVDVVLIPVGGFYTIDARTALQVVLQLNPRVVIPMHYKTADLTPSLAGQLAPVDDFLKAVGDQAAVTMAGQTITLEKDKLPDRLTVMVLQYRP